MALKRFDDKLVEGEHMNFQDKGPVSKGAKTKKFLVTNAVDHSVMGYVKFFVQWREYVFFPLTTKVRGCYMQELVDFCREATNSQREKRQAFPASAQEQVVEGSR